ncbi:MAG: hypothetical protein JNL51_04965 [Chitinophagaceae bacterium]|nr:hypothetical protein [Chitinophagaceae bacterium]
MKPVCFLLLAVILNSAGVKAQRRPVPTNYDESKIPPYTLPDPLLSINGKKISSAKEWEKKQRPYVLALFTEHVYGRIPGKPQGMHFELTDIDNAALNGTAIRKQVTAYFGEGPDAPSMNILLYLPKNSPKAPVFVGLNFKGNHRVNADKGILISRHWKKETPDDIPTLASQEALRGTTASRWEIEEAIKRGYGVATVHYEDIEVDDKDGWKQGFRTTLKDRLHIQPESWSAISVWAWALSRIQDYLETDPAVDATKTIVIGHSRLGKTALWAAANDRRFAIAISNNSGEGGAALSRRLFGETIWDLNNTFPHWFVAKYKTYNNKADQLPVDQHMLLSLIAPRPLYVASASEDLWADPKGEFLSAKNAEPVYRLYKFTGLGGEEMPAENHPVGDRVRYHIRTGKHDITLYDWNQYMDFADKYLR